ncbi:MAG: hypothetical protein F7C35_04020 [Desulfurococcales archaeon]|nr:hypothetical protein [Desulfurococcales archaeon]
MKRCKINATLIVYVPLAASMPGVVAMLRERGEIKSVNEEIRRVVARLPLEAVYAAIWELKERYGIGVDRAKVEIVAICPRPIEWKPPNGSRLLKRGNRVLFSEGVCRGRYYQAEVKGPVIVVKVGRRARLKRVTSPLPESQFILDEAPTIEEVVGTVECVVGGDGI